MPPELILSKCYLLESDNYESIADGYFQAALLSEESSKQYPALSSGLAEFNKQISASCREDFKELADKARQYIAENGISDEDRASATFESRIVPVRQDDKAVSFFTSCYSFLPGAAGGTTTFRGITLDTASGKMISLKDIIRDLNNKKALVIAVNENLRFMSTGDPAGDREESVSEALASENFFPTWVLSDSGVIFRFNPGAISTEEEGAVEAEISFEKYPDLFTDLYAPHKGAYTLPTDTVYPVMADLNGDGTLERVSLNARPDTSGDLGSYTALRVAVGDKECLHETYFFNARGVLIHTDKGKNYLYVAYGIYKDDDRQDNDCQVLLRYKMKKLDRFAGKVKFGEFYDRGPAKPLDKYFIYTGNTNWGVQNMAYDPSLKKMFLFVYKGSKPAFPNYDTFIFDIAIKPVKKLVDGVWYDKSKHPMIGSPEKPVGGVRFKYGSTGVSPLGDGLFYISENGRNPETGLQNCRARLYKWDGMAFAPVSD